MRVSKKLIALALAGSVFAAPVALAEDEEATIVEETIIDEESNENEDAKIYAQNEWANPFTTEKFDETVKENLPEISQKLKSKKKSISNLPQQLNCAVFLTNLDRMPEFDYKVLIGTEVHGNDILNGEFKNFEDANHFFNLVRDYNCEVVRGLDNYIYLERINFNNYDKDVLNKYLKKVIKNKKYSIINAFVDYNKEIGYDDEDLNIQMEDFCLDEELPGLVPYIKKVVEEGYDLKTAITEYNKALIEDVLDRVIDISTLIHDDADRELAHDIHINWVLSNISVAGELPLIENEYYNTVKGQLADLNGVEQTGNVSELGIGARLLVEKIYGISLVNTIQEYIRENIDKEEIFRYFVRKDFAENNWVLRDDVDPEVKIFEKEIDLLVGDRGDLIEYAAPKVNNDLMAYIVANCLSISESNTK